MQPQRLLSLHIFFWLLLLLALMDRGPLASAIRWAEACGPGATGCGRPGQPPTLHTGDEAREVADPWAFGSSGSRLDAGYGPGQQRPGLLP